ncbi:hypothetical protein EUTSA_v10015350mg [Eutrema salsugineum]|uniref:FBD domain-containing protein n=1 Tax=Eutrema salsugineum TaxID=72664 RepID=V4LLK5_EUTSA|nr:hypothetical protein EUTSA_v10015350mg [Eutrema salsugineum]
MVAPDIPVTRWVDTVIKLKIQHFHVNDFLFCDNEFDEVQIPPTLYTCKSLVSLHLCDVTMPDPEFVSLPCLKAIVLDIVNFAGDSALEKLILGCPDLESLDITRSLCDDTEVLRVRSQSLLSFTIVSDSDDHVEDLLLAIDAPRLQYLSLSDGRTASFVLNNMGSLVKAHIDTVFGGKYDSNDIQKRNMIRDFLLGISRVKDMIIASTTLEVIYDHSRREPLPLFRNLSFLRVEFGGYRWGMLPVFLERCSNLKSLVVGSITNREEKVGIYVLPLPRCSLASLEYVEIKRPLKGEAMEMELVSYLLENSTILKKLTLCLDGSKKKEESVILKQLLNIPRLSASCQVVVL